MKVDERVEIEKRYFYCHKHRLTAAFSLGDPKTACQEGLEPLGEGFPLGTVWWLHCSACKLFWQEKGNYRECPGCHKIAGFLYQCYNCRTFTLETTGTNITLIDTFECRACEKKAENSEFLTTHKCSVTMLMVISRQTSCKLCKKTTSLNKNRKERSSENGIITSHKDSTGCSSPSITGAISEKQPIIDKPMSDKSNESNDSTLSSGKPIITMPEGESLGDSINYFWQQFEKWLKEKPYRNYTYQLVRLFVIGVILYYAKVLLQEPLKKGINNAPVINEISWERKPYLKGEKPILVADVFDADGDQLTFKWAASNGAEIKGEGKQVTIDTSKCIVLAPDANVEVTLIVADKYHQSAPCIQTLQIVNPVNTPPNVGVISLLEGTDKITYPRHFPIEVKAENKNGDKLSFSWSCSNPLIKITPETDNGKAWVETTGLHPRDLPLKITIYCSVTDGKVATPISSKGLELTILPPPRKQLTKRR
jgi:hypothetical protein